MHPRLTFALGAAAVAGWLAGANAQTLTMGLAAEPTSVDPHYHTFGPNETVDIHIFDLLTDFDAGMHIQPALATSWKLIDDTTWEFKLRPGVKFHNGADFTAEDVAYTIARVPTVPNSPGSFAVYTKPVTRVEIIDPLTIRLHTAGVFPLLPIDMSQVFIIPHGLGPMPATEDFNSGKDAIGTGPYASRRLQVRRSRRTGPQRRLVGSQARLAARHGAHDPQRRRALAALLAGDVQFIEFVPARRRHAHAHRQAGGAGGHQLRCASSICGSTVRAHGPEPFVSGPNGEKLDKNPFNDLRVRQALSIAINRPLIVERVMERRGDAHRPVPGARPLQPRARPRRAEIRSGPREAAAAPRPATRTVSASRCTARTTVTSTTRRSSRRSARCGRASACRPTVDAMTWTNFIGRANKQDFSAYLLAWGIAHGRGVRPAARLDRDLQRRRRAWARSTAAAIPTRRSTR